MNRKRKCYVKKSPVKRKTNYNGMTKRIILASMKDKKEEATQFMPKFTNSIDISQVIDIEIDI